MAQAADLWIDEKLFTLQNDRNERSDYAANEEFHSIANLYFRDRKQVGESVKFYKFLYLLVVANIKILHQVFIVSFESL